MSEHKVLILLVVLASLMSLAWLLIIYVLSFHVARRLVDKIAVNHVPCTVPPRASAVWLQQAYLSQPCVRPTGLLLMATNRPDFNTRTSRAMPVP